MNSNKGVIKLLISILLIIPILAISGCADSDGEETGLLFELSLEKIEVREEDGEMVWDVFIMIDNIEPEDEDIGWGSIDIIILEKGTNERKIPPTTPYRYEYTSSGYLDVWYEDLTGIPGKANWGDVIVLTSVTEDCEGATIKLEYKKDPSGSMVLPDEFPTE